VNIDVLLVLQNVVADASKISVLQIGVEVLVSSAHASVHWGESTNHFDNTVANRLFEFIL